MLKHDGRAARVRRSGGSLLVEGPDPVGVAVLFEHLPGVAWIAAGYRGKTIGELARAAALLSSRYLGKGAGFLVDAEASGGGHPSDVSGPLTSAILGRVKGTKVKEDEPSVRIRAALDGESGAVGVELRRGPGGTPTGRARAACLVSGGVRSSVVAWMTVLAGSRVELVHANGGERGVRAAARLYSELSHRSDPRGLKLVVLDGAPAASLLFGYAARAAGQVFGGFTPSSGPPDPRFGGRVLAPLFVAPDDLFREAFQGLGAGGEAAKTDWESEGGGRASSREFGGKKADVSEVLDGLA